MTTPDGPPAVRLDEDGTADCQREGTCCLRCYADFGTCCTHDGPPPLWVLETS